MNDGTALHKFRLTISQLDCLSVKLHLPNTIITSSSDKCPRLETLALLCRRLSEPSRLFTVANEFGRSAEACSRILRATINIIYARYSAIVYLNQTLWSQRAEEYAQAICAKSSLSEMRACVGFIDGTTFHGQVLEMTQNLPLMKIYSVQFTMVTLDDIVSTIKAL
ncbi:hypothetical protein AC1031_021901 [Aphanomyces cochlioides]|nr:hypothetical protein AC1031_021901 [Aphanomyces cochlioides]